ncbi:phospholipase D family protein [Nocardioides sp.]|uniref:phospholipase D family protein n=1 Tax=Nocardioides sp. TaxID=35761 RepID=UPI0039E23540
MRELGATPQDWFLSAEERGNPDTGLDEGGSWSRGNRARPLVHGAAYFAALSERLEETGAGDLVLFTDWQGDADELLTGEPGSELVEVMGRALERGADVRALVWRSHSRLLGYSTESHHRLGELLQERGADICLDMKVRPGGAHHQKFVVIRHRADPSRDVAFVGGIDLCHGRRDDARHLGDPQAEPIAEEYGDTPPWHDVQLELTGPVVRAVETVFRERWEDTGPRTRNPIRGLQDRVRGLDEPRRPLPPQAPPPPPVAGHDHAVQLLRTYPALGVGWSYDFAGGGERSVARGYTKALERARSLIYLEDQFLWGQEMSSLLVEALREHPGLHLIAVLPRVPDQDGWFARDPQTLGRLRAIRGVVAAAPDRVALYAPENHAGTPVYVHAKVCVVDDSWATVGSDNFCRRSWTNDSELSAAVVDLGGEGLGYARRLRLTLAGEHLDRIDPDPAAGEPDDDRLAAAMSDCVDAAGVFAAFSVMAEALEEWHRGGRVGPRPPGRLRRLPLPSLPLPRQVIAAPSYRYLHDPDGRPWRLRRHRTY